VLSVTRHRVPAPEAPAFLEQAQQAMDLLRARPGFESGAIGRSTDDADLWVLTTTWTDVGSFRRALSAIEVKMHAVPVLASAIDEPTAFERLVTAGPAEVRTQGSDRAVDADWAGPGSVR
jgi:quinol monooxygenase YgiN